MSPSPTAPPPETEPAGTAAAPAGNRWKNWTASPKAGWKSLQAETRRRWTITKNFAKELFADHGFWVEALAVKGGASAILAAGIVTASYLIAMPFLAAATGIAACTGLVALGVYGIGAGSMKAWESLKAIYARATGKAPKEHVYVERKDLLQRLRDSKPVKKILHHPLSRKFFESRAWQITEKFSQKREDSILGGIAVGGAALTLTLGAIALTSQLLVLPVVAAGTLLTFATVTAATSIASGCSGLYFSITGLRDRAAHKREMLAAQAARAAQQAVQNNAGGPVLHDIDLGAAPALNIPESLPKEPPLAAETIAARFEAAAAPVNDNLKDKDPAGTAPKKAVRTESAGPKI